MREAILLVLAASSALIGAAQRDVSTEAYLALIVRYSWGERAAVTTELAEWTFEEVQTARHDLRLVLPIVSKRHDISEDALIATAMVVHVDLARRAGSDEAVDRNLALGQRLSDLLPAGNAGDQVTHFRARWHHAAGTVLCGFSRPHHARPQFEIARKLRPADSGILLALGSVHEVEGSLLAHKLGGPGMRASPASERGESPHERLAQAAALFGAALQSTPDLDEARLRLARTQLLSGRPDVAAVTIGPLLETAEGPYLRYLVRLIGGGISSAQGRSDETIARYRAARAMCGRCPTASVGLSHALLRQGDREAAHELVRQVVTDDAWPPPGDPWWMYQQGQWRAIDAILETLRQEVPK